MRRRLPGSKGPSRLRKLRHVLITIGLGFVTFLGGGFIYGGASGIIGGITHDDPVLAGPGRLHDAFVEEVPCNRNQTLVCDYERSAKLDLPDGHTEVLNQEPLYDLVRRKGPVTVQIEWDKELASATRVRYGDHWYRAGHPRDADVVSSVLLFVFGIPLFLLAGVFFLGQFLPDEDDDAADEPSGRLHPAAVDAV